MIDKNNDGILSEEDLLKGFTFFTVNGEQILNSNIVKKIVQNLIILIGDIKSHSILSDAFVNFIKNMDTT
jgi:hypothetical protein